MAATPSELMFFHLTIISDSTKAPEKCFLSAKEHQSIGDALSNYVSDDSVISSIKCSGNEDGRYSGTDTPVGTPIRTLKDFGTKFVFLNVSSKKGEDNPKACPGKSKSAFDVLMAVQKKYNVLPEPRQAVTAKDKVYNEVLKLLKNSEVGFTAMQVKTTGLEICRVLTNALWYIDPHHDKLENRGILLPQEFRNISGYYDWRAQKKKAPQISAKDLKKHVTALVDMTMMPWFLNDAFKAFRNKCSLLTDGLKKYLTHLEQQQQRTASHHASETPLRSVTDSWTMGIIEASTETKLEYQEVETKLQDMGLYEPVYLSEFEPDDRYDRRQWLQNIRLSFPVRLYQHHHGNYFGNFNFLWKIEVNLEDRADQDLDAIATIRQDLFTYSTRAIMKTFILRYSKVNALKPAIMRDVFHFLTQDSSAAETKSQGEVDERVAKFLLNSDDAALFYDLRKNNGRPMDAKLDPFWDGLQKHLDNISVVHDRRHGDQSYMPIAMSLQHLIDIIAKELPLGSRLPSVSWLRFNFWPSNAYSKDAINYTGRFKVRYAVQQRLLRSKHPDSAYCFNQLAMMKEMAVSMRENSSMICLDDKSVIPIGEPNSPISTGVRAASKSLAADGHQLKALDHDFHVHGAVPSVMFNINIPEDSKDSFYDGSLHVTVKNKVFEPSTAMRHTTETLAILRQDLATENGLSLDKPLLFIFTDGGPDHRSTYWSVQIALLALFIQLDLDLLVSARTAPSHSYCNPAERCMSLLNLALQNSSFARRSMDETAEYKVKSRSTLKQLRQLAEKQPQLKESLIGSVEPVLAKLKQRFSELKLHMEPVQVHDAASDVDMKAVSECLDIFLDEGDNLFEKVPKKGDVSRYPKLKQFIEDHCQERHYSFQIKKCTSWQTCWYCAFNPPRIDEFESIHFLPDPTLDQNKDKWVSFADLYGKTTTDSDRPALKEKSTAGAENDKDFKGLLVAAKVRDVIMCGEFGKRRVIYSKQRLSSIQQTALDRVQEELSYSCGSQLFPRGHAFHDVMRVREGLSCSSQIEITYYADVTHRFIPVCFYCGNDDDLSTGDVVSQLRKQYFIVRPICQPCLEAGKQPAVRNALKVGQKRK